MYVYLAELAKAVANGGYTMTEETALMNWTESFREKMMCEGAYINHELTVFPAKQQVRRTSYVFAEVSKEARSCSFHQIKK